MVFLPINPPSLSLEMKLCVTMVYTPSLSRKRRNEAVRYKGKYMKSMFPLPIISLEKSKLKLCVTTVSISNPCFLSPLIPSLSLELKLCVTMTGT